MKRQISALLLVALAVAGCRKEFKPAEWVDPYIGSGGHGHVFVGADVPYGAVKLGPTQPYRGWDWCSGYHYSDSVILGFSHTHLNGTGIGELGDILVLPVTAATPRDEMGRLYTSLDHARETVKPGYYALATDEGIHAELTAGRRAGYHRYRFPEKEASLLLDLGAGIGWDSMTHCSVKRIDDTHIEGYRRSTGWAKDQWCYFAMEFSSPIVGETQDGDNRTLYTFATDDGVLEIKAGISAVSSENARENIAADLGDLTFDAAVAAATDEWNKALGTVEITPLDAKQGRIFYTALYHTMTAPSLFVDANGQYRGADGDVHVCEGDNYTIFSLWDTYRAASPLLTITDPQRARALGATMMRIYREQGKLPVWHLNGNETDCMVGNPGVIIMGDLLLKGLVENPGEVLEAMKASSMLDERGMELLKVYGYLPFDKSAELETVAKGLEFAIADDAVARAARMLGDSVAAQYFGERSKSYRRYFDPETRFMRGRAADGSWRTPFDPFLALHMQSDYTEGNAWQYTWLVPHDIDGLMELLGGREAFLAKLEEFFVAEGDLGPAANDVTGLIGQYAHGNEPSHHIAYMFNYADRQERCAQLVRQILDELYRDEPDGLCGNEDVGQMSAWYVLSSLGLYQVEPAGGAFMIGSPAVKRAEIKVGEGRTFTISAPNNSHENIYIASVKLNGKPLARPYITYEQIMEGGTLEFEMSPVIVRPFDDGSGFVAPLEFEEMVHDFELIREEDGPVSFDYIFENTTSEPLAVVRVLTPCSCLTADFSTRPVEPRQRGKITLTYNPSYREGFFSETIDIIYVQNDRQRYSRIWANGNVLPMKHPIEEDHPYDLGEGLRTNLKVFLLGGVTEGSQKSILFRYANAQDKNVELTFEVEGSAAAAVDMPRKISMKPDQRGEMHITYNAPEGIAGLQELTIRPYVDGKPAEAIPMTVINLPAIDRTAEKRPLAVCRTTDFTVEKTAGEQTFEFVMENKGSAPLNIVAADMPSNVKSTLKKGTRLAAGEERAFEVRIETSGEECHDRLYIVTDDPATPYFIIRVDTK